MPFASDLDPYDDTGSFFGSIAHAVTHNPVTKAVSKAAKGVSKGVDAVGNTLSKVPLVGAGLKGLTTLTIGPYQAALNVASGQRIDRAALNSLKSQVGAAKAVAPYVQSVISFIPGVGQGMSGAISASLALAEGKPISEAVLAAAKGALPGGPLAAAAFDVAAAAAQGKSISDVALAGLPISPTQRDILKQSLAVAKDIAHGKSVSQIAMNRVNDNLKKLPPVVQKAAQVGVAMGHAKNLQSALKTGAKGAVSIGASSIVKGKNMNPFIAAAKALGSSQAGIQKAVGAAQALKNGSPVLTKALNSAAGNFAHGSPGHVGFSTAVHVLKQTSGNKAALGAARRAFPTEAARHAFDSAIGVVSHTVSKNPAALAKRAGSVFNPQLGKKPGVISPYQPNLKHAIDSIKKNPTLANQHPMVLANKFGTSQQVVLQALKHVSTHRLLPWRSLSPTAARFVKKWHPNAPLNALTHGTSDTAGLDETGTKYIVEKGDGPFKIAQKLTGNGNRWTELKALNTDKKPGITVNVWVGEVLNIPASWQKPTAKQAPPPGPAVAQQPSPTAPSVIVTPAPIISVVPGTLQAKAILVAWSKTDGINQAGVPDYGSTAADLSTDFGSRDSLELMAFQSWAGKTGLAPLDVDGKLGPKSLAALQNWAERRATQATPVTPTLTASIPGQVTTLPEIVIEGSAPSLPSASKPIPVSTPAVVASTPAIPPVATPAQPATPATVAASAPASGGKMAPALAGAAVGGVLFGLPGAIIGGIAGAAMA